VKCVKFFTSDGGVFLGISKERGFWLGGGGSEGGGGRNKGTPWRKVISANDVDSEVRKSQSARKSGRKKIEKKQRRKESRRLLLSKKRKIITGSQAQTNFWEPSRGQKLGAPPSWEASWGFRSRWHRGKNIFQAIKRASAS